MSRPQSRRRIVGSGGRAAVVLLLAAVGWLATAAPASADTTVMAFPTAPAADDGSLPCLPINPFCVVGEAAGAVVADVWISAMLSLWEAGLWLLGLAFSVIDALATPDLSAEGPLAAVYPVTFGIGATVAVMMAMVQLGVAAVRRDGQTLGRLLIGLLQFGLVWVGYVGVAALLVTGVSGLTTALLRSLLDIDTLAAFDPSISVGRDLVDGTVATVLGVSSHLPAGAGQRRLPAADAGPRGGADRAGRDLGDLGRWTAGADLERVVLAEPALVPRRAAGLPGRRRSSSASASPSPRASSPEPRRRAPRPRSAWRWSAAC